jgi:hypothetical protein
MKLIVRRSVNDKRWCQTFLKAPHTGCVAIDPVNTCSSLGDILYKVNDVC